MGAEPRLSRATSRRAELGEGGQVSGGEKVEGGPGPRRQLGDVALPLRARDKDGVGSGLDVGPEPPQRFLHPLLLGPHFSPEDVGAGVDDRWNSRAFRRRPGGGDALRRLLERQQLGGARSHVLQVDAHRARAQHLLHARRHVRGAWAEAGLDVSAQGHRQRPTDAAHHLDQLLQRHRLGVQTPKRSGESGAARPHRLEARLLEHQRRGHVPGIAEHEGRAWPVKRSKALRTRALSGINRA